MVSILDNTQISDAVLLLKGNKMNGFISENPREWRTGNMLNIRVIPLIAVLLSGCGVVTGPQVKVGMAKLQDAINKSIGEMDVKRQEIKDAMQSSKQTLNSYRASRITMQIQLEQFDKKMAPYLERKEKTESMLKEMLSAMKDKMPFVISGKKYEGESLGKLAKDMINIHDANESSLKGLEIARSNLSSTLESLNAKEKVITDTLTDFSQQLSILDSQLIAAKEIEKTATVVGDNTASMEESMAAIQEKINKLGVDVRVRIGTINDSTNGAGALTKQISDAESLLGKTKAPATIADIEKALGGK